MQALSALNAAPGTTGHRLRAGRVSSEDDGTWCLLVDAGDVAPEMRVRVPYPVHPSGHLLFVGRVKSATRDGTVSIWQWECGDTYVEEFDMMTVPIEVDTDVLPDGFVAPAGPVLAARTPIAKPSANSPVRPTNMPRTRKSKKRRRCDPQRYLASPERVSVVPRPPGKVHQCHGGKGAEGGRQRSRKRSVTLGRRSVCRDAARFSG